MRANERKAQNELNDKIERIDREARQEKREERALDLFERIVKACEIIAIEAQHWSEMNELEHNRQGR